MHKRRTPHTAGGCWRDDGYQEYLEAIVDPEHEEHETVLRRRGAFDPEAFRPDEVNQRLWKRFRSAGKTANSKVSARVN